MGFKNTIRSFKNVAKAGLAAAGGYAGGYGYSKRKSGGSSWIKKKFKKRRYGKKRAKSGGKSVYSKKRKGGGFIRKNIRIGRFIKKVQCFWL